MQQTDPIHPWSRFLRVDAGTGTLKQRKYHLKVVSGPIAGRRVELDQGTLVVGSAPTAAICLADSSVSRHHFELVPRSDGVLVRDLGSTNGTLIAGARINEAVIQSAVIEAGRSAVSVSFEDEDLGRPQGGTAFGQMLGTSAAMRSLFGILERIAPSDSTVLVTGETGTGKEVLARSIHAASPRAGAPFVVVDCAGLSEALVESELFGHVKGAFTGAVADRPGAFALADRGTLFLDEVAELPLEVQPRLLRAIDARTVKAVGSSAMTPFDARIIASTRKDLEHEMRAGRFREDLFYRLAVVLVAVPPLRDRRDDVPLLARHFVAELGRAEFSLSDELLQQLGSFEWQGNVRELHNVVQRALTGVALDGQPVARRVPGASELAELPFKEAKERIVDAFARDYISALYERCERNVSKVARLAEIDRSYAQQLLSKYGLR